MVSATTVFVTAVSAAVCVSVSQAYAGDCPVAIKNSLLAQGSQLERISAATTGRVFSLDQALRLAVDSHPQLRAELARSRIADAEIISAKALPNPALLSDNGVAEDSYRLGIQQTFLLGGKIKNRVAIAAARKEALSAELTAAMFQLRREARIAYVQLYVAQQRVRVLQDLVDHYDRLRHAATNLEDQLQIEFIETVTVNDLKSAEHQARLAMNTFNAIVSQPIDVEVVVEKPRTTIAGNVSRNQIVSAAKINGPLLAQNRAITKAADRELDLARANKIPNFTIAFGPDMVTPPEVTQFSVFAIGYVDLPVLNRQQGPIQEARARQNQAVLAKTAIERRVELSIANAYENYKYTLDRIADFEAQIIPRAQDMQATALIAKSKNNLTVDTLVEADTHRATTELAYLSVLRENQEAIAELEIASGLEL